jgi:hypothetical protein
MASANASGETNSESSDLGLRRSYGLSDMKLHACTTPTEGPIAAGVACPSSLVVFGPYVTVPAHSSVKLRFEIEAHSDLTVTSDVVSNSAKQFHAAFEEQTVRQNEKRIVSYRLHVFEQVRSLETRIGIKSESPADFEIGNFDLLVE